MDAPDSAFKYAVTKENAEDSCTTHADRNDSSQAQPIFLKEFAPLTHILRHIPQQAQKGLNKIDIRLTCISVVPEYVAIGSNVGLLYLYDRHKNSMQKLKCAEASNGITCLSLVRSVDFMLAVGCQSGLCAVFLVPTVGSRTMERYVIDQVHHTPVTCLCWSQNAMKMFSGDSRGLIVCTHIDYEQHVSRSEEVLVEEYPIIQLDYTNQVLLVSTAQRTLLCHLSRHALIPLGQQPRKSIGNFGACFVAGPQRQGAVYASRPGMRLWMGNSEGVVLETLLLRDALSTCVPLAPLLALPRAASPGKLQECQFGPLVPHGPRLLLTWSSEALFVVDPSARTFVAVCTGFTNVGGVASCGDEIFVLQGKRHLVRLAPHPEDLQLQEEDDKFLPDMQTIKDSLVVPLAEIGALLKEHNRPISQSPIVQLFKNKNNSSSVLQWIKQKSPLSPFDGETRNNGPAAESIEVEAADAGKAASAISPKGDTDVRAGNPTEESQGSAEDEEAIVFCARQRSRHRKQPSSADAPPAASAPVPTYDQVIAAQETFPKEQFRGADDRASPHPPPPYDGPEDEKLLQILRCFEKSQQDDARADDRSTAPNVVDSCEEVAAPGTAFNIDETPAECDNAIQSGASIQSDADRVADEDESPPTEEGRKNSLPEDDIYHRHGDARDALPRPAPPPQLPVAVEPDGSPDYSCKWVCVRSPGPVVSLAVCNSYLCCVDNKEVVHYSRQWGREFTWKKSSRPANRVALSPSGGALWVLYKDRLYAAVSPATDKPLAEYWREVAEGVVSFDLTESTAWCVTSTGLVAMCPDTAVVGREAFVVVPCLFKVQQVACHEDVVWVLTEQGALLARTGVTSGCPQGRNWAEIAVPSHASPCCVALGNDDVGWLIDSDGGVWFKTELKDAAWKGVCGEKWWQLDLNEYVFQGAPPLAKVQKNLSSLLSNASHVMLGRCKWLLVAGSRGVWFCQNMATALYSCRRDITGYLWERAHVNSLPVEVIKWTYIEAGGVFQDQGVVWGLQTGGRLVAIPPGGKCVNVEAPEPLVGLSASPECLWALTCRRQVLVRVGQSIYSPMGTGWAQLNTSQLDGVHLVHVSCNHEVGWACDSHGRVYVRLGSPLPCGPHSLPQAWFPVDTLDAQDALPNVAAVYVGPESYMVWAVDTKRRVYVREGIFPELQIGTGWLEVRGVQAKALCLSASAVWALGVSGDVFRRFAIGPSNFVGDYWKKVPANLAALSVSVDDRLWGVGPDGSAQRLNCHLLPYQGGSPVPSTPQVGTVEDDWELL